MAEIYIPTRVCRCRTPRPVAARMCSRAAAAGHRRANPFWGPRVSRRRPTALSSPDRLSPPVGVPLRTCSPLPLTRCPRPEPGPGWDPAWVPDVLKYPCHPFVASQRLRGTPLCGRNRPSAVPRRHSVGRCDPLAPSVGQCGRSRALGLPPDVPPAPVIARMAGSLHPHARTAISFRTHALNEGCAGLADVRNGAIAARTCCADSHEEPCLFGGRSEPCLALILRWLSACQNEEQKYTFPSQI